MKNYTETRTLFWSDLRSLCIKHDWYTRGTNEEYAAMLDSLCDDMGCPVPMTTEKLAEIATDIYEHSTITDYTITSIMFELAKSCNTFFDEV